MARDDSSSDPSFIEALIDRVRRHPFVLLIVALGAAIGFVASFRVNIEQAFKQNADPPPVVRMQRFQLSGDAVSLLLLGKIDDRLRQTLGGRPIVWQNAVYRETAALHGRFARPLGDNAMDGTTESENRSIDAATPLLSGATARTLGLDPEKVFALTGAPPGGGWSVAFVAEPTPIEIGAGLAGGAMPASALLFSRSIDCTTAMRLLAEGNEPEAAFYSALAQRGCGTLRLPLTARYEDVSCGGSGWYVTLTLPKVRMDVLVIQNLSDKPITINRISGPSLPGSRVGDGTLTAEDRLLIPTALWLQNAGIDNETAAPTFQLAQLNLPAERDREVAFFETTLEAPGAPAAETSGGSGDAGEGADDATAAPVADAQAHLVADTAEPSPVERRTTQFAMSIEAIANAYGDARAAMHAPVSLVPEVAVTNLEVDGIDIAVQPVQAGETYIANHYVGASCPHLVMTGADGMPASLGKILVGRDSPARIGSNRRHLSFWPTGIAVAEADPETTYLHGIKAVCERSDGRKEEFAGAPADPARMDFPMTLAQGNRIPFIFGRPAAPERCATIYVEARGYYVPHDSAIASRSLRTRLLP